MIEELRGYEYSIVTAPWTGHLPVYFRHFRGFISDNRKHDIIDCDVYDQDPLINDMAVISVWGTGLGLSYKDEWGTVTNRCRFGSFRGEQKPNGSYPLIVRKSVSDFPAHGK